MENRYQDKVKYQLQRAAAKYRNVEFLLSFDEWYDIWQQSGHYQDRGVGKDKYCMSRFNDEGPYSVGNVFIQTNSENGKDQSGKSKPNTWTLGTTQSEETKQKRKNTRMSNGYSFNSWSGKQMTKESSDKKSFALKGKPWSEARRKAQLEKNK